jgi:V-type H+-transporting ATPase subunit E
MASGMDDDEVQKQLDHMVKFIYREADEKASEIHAKGQEEFTIEKARIVQEEKLKIMKEFERKEKQIEVRKKIAYSNELNISRLRTLKAREEGVQRVLGETHKRLSALTKDPNAYKQLLKKLIIQGLWKLQEANVILVVRKQDVQLVKDVVKDATEEYKRKAEKECDVTLDTTQYLPPGPEHATNDSEICSGGIVLSSNEGRIICSNTLDARLSMSYEQNLPKLRTVLFGKSLTRMHYD